MTPQEADTLYEQVARLDDDQLWLLIRWLMMEWARRMAARYGR